MKTTVLLVILFICLFKCCLGDTDLTATAPLNDTETEAILAYSNTEGFTAQDVVSGSSVLSLTVTVPSPFNSSFTDPASPRLPISPVQTIYRFQYINISKSAGASSPFEYVEIDWNTEGLARGPNNSFVNPHFDFHFYIQPRSFLIANVSCPQLSGPSIGRVCDPTQTSYEQLGNFLRVPHQAYMPNNYFTDSGSYITQMGLHHLDNLMVYSIENVNLSPVVLYGSYDSKVLFLETSITAYGFQNVMQNGKQSWPIRLPNGVSTSRWWPQSVSLEYDSSTTLFTLTLDDMTYL